MKFLKVIQTGDNMKSMPAIRNAYGLKKAGMLLLGAAFVLSAAAQPRTTVEIRFPDHPVKVDPMIYGQMLENVNDSMIYGGVVDKKGNEQLHVTPLVRDLNIPVMRWPGGTVVYEYRWKNGIGPRALRPTVPTLAWNGEESYQFGTDEFLQWCKRVGTEPYININMGGYNPLYMGTLWEALEWIEYVNGSPESNFGKLRAYNGHEQPYNVKYWCIGNENYLPSRAARIQDPDTVYANRLKIWTTAIKERYPDLRILGVGRSTSWNKTVLETTGKNLHFLTQHYYVNAKLKDGELVNPSSTLFAPAKMEAHLKLLGAQLEEWNRRNGREQDPIRLSIDEWNDRHALYDGNNFKFTRQSPRRQFDVAVAAGMLNAFVRQSPHVGMANYIFPVNAHGLIRTVGTDDAYLTPLYYLFKQYRSRMLGQRLDLVVKGPGLKASEADVSIDGDAIELNPVWGDEHLNFVDAAAVENEGRIVVSLVNRSHNQSQLAELVIPTGYRASEIWELNHQSINARNMPDNRFEITPRSGKLKQNGNKATVRLLPCALAMIELEKIK